MSTLIVQLPPRELEQQPLPDWQWPELAFALLDAHGHVQRAGRAALAQLPQAAATVLIAAARDVLLVAAAVPPLKGPKLRQALPNIIEDQLIQDPQQCHIALDPQPLPDGRRVLGVIDRAWLRFVTDAFGAAGYRRVRVVPATRCLPAPRGTGAVPPVVVETLAATAEAGGALGAEAEAVAVAEMPLGPVPVVAAVYPDLAARARLDAQAAGDGAAQRLELMLARGALGEGLTVTRAGAAATLAALVGDWPCEVYQLDEPGAEPRLSSVPRADAERLVPGAAALPFDAYARTARAVRFDLCQFDFESSAWRFDAATLARLRLPALLLAGIVAVSMLGMNLHWWQLARQRDALHAQLVETLLTAFPKTSTVLDPPAQMSAQLDRLRIAAGELSPNDFLALASGLTRSLEPISVEGIAALDYQDRRLVVAFKSGVTVDAGFAERLARNGLRGELETNTGKWTIRSRS